MKKIMLFLLIVAPFSLALAQTETSSKVVVPAQFQKEMEQEKVQLIDIRTPEEFEEGHLEAAVNIDFLSEDFLKEMAKLDEDRPLLIYCRSGNRSAKATLQLQEQGFSHITDLKGGYEAWVEFLKN